MIYFIVNTASKSGNGKDTWLMIKYMLYVSQISYKAYETKYPGHAMKIAEKITQNEADDDICLVVVGGDGTVNEVINGIKDFGRVRLAVIPSGSGNDFVNGLNIELELEEHVQYIFDKIGHGRNACRSIDLGKVKYKDESGVVKSRYYGISSGVGLDALVCKKAETTRLKKILNALKLGKLTYVVLTVINLFTMKTTSAAISYIGDVERQGLDKYTQKEKTSSKLDKMIFMACMNLPKEGGGVPMAPKASAKDGWLSTLTVGNVPKIKTFFLLPKLVLAKHEKTKGFRLNDSEKVMIKMSEAMTLHTDGEYLGDVKEAIFSIEPDKLKLIM